MNLSYFLTIIALALSVISANAQTTSLNTVPEGVTTYNLAATGAAQNTTTYFSAPLSNDPVYTGAVSALSAVSLSTDNTISVADSPAPWTANQFQPGATPYFVKFLSGLQSGRVIEVLSNTTNSLTLDTTDHSSQTVALNITGFSVAVGDTFEVFAGDTLALMFGSAQGSLVLVGGTGLLNSDTVGLYNPALLRTQVYYFNTTAGYWELSGSSVNANNTVVYPYSSFSITRRPSEPATSFVLMGRVPEVNRLIKTTGGNASIYDSVGYPVDMPLSQVQLGSNWATGSSVISADTLAVWDAATIRFDTYFQEADLTWRKSGGTTDVSSFVIPAGTTVIFTKHTAVSGTNSFLQPVMPYTLN